MKRCGPLDPETGVAHRSRKGHGGCLVRAEISKNWESEPWQRQSSGLRWGKTSWVRYEEIPCLHLSCRWVFLLCLTWKPAARALGNVISCKYRAQQSLGRQSRNKECISERPVRWIEVSCSLMCNNSSLRFIHGIARSSPYCLLCAK